MSRRRPEAPWDAIWERTRPGRGVDADLPEFAPSSQGPVETAAPPLDVWEEADRVVVEVELPGVDRRSVSVTAADGRLVIEGRKSRAGDAGCQGFLRLEREFGFFRRVVELPWPVDLHGAQASLRDGLLAIRLTKVAERRRQVRVHIASED